MDCQGVEHPNNMVEETDKDEHTPDEDGVSRLDVMERNSSDASIMHGYSLVIGSMKGVKGQCETSPSVQNEGVSSAIAPMYNLLALPLIVGFEFSSCIGETIETDQMFPLKAKAN